MILHTCFQYAHVIQGQVLIALSCNDAGTIILEPFKAIPFMIVISSLSNQYS